MDALALGGVSRTRVSDGEHVHPTRDDSVVTALSEGVGGPMGGRGRGTG